MVFIFLAFAFGSSTIATTVIKNVQNLCIRVFYKPKQMAFGRTSKYLHKYRKCYF